MISDDDESFDYMMIEGLTARLAVLYVSGGMVGPKEKTKREQEI